MIRTLIIDDDYEMRRVLRRILESEGHEVLEASDGRDFERLIEDDAVLLAVESACRRDLQRHQGHVVAWRRFLEIVSSRAIQLRLAFICFERLLLQAQCPRGSPLGGQDGSAEVHGPGRESDVLCVAQQREGPVRDGEVPGSE